MKIKLTAHIHYVKYNFEEVGEYQVYSCSLGDAEHRTYVGEQEIEVEVPDNYDPRPQQIAALEKQRQEIRAEFQKSIVEINERISNLQALEYTA